MSSAERRHGAGNEVGWASILLSDCTKLEDLVVGGGGKQRKGSNKGKANNKRALPTLLVREERGERREREGLLL